MVASSSLSATSICCASIAALARTINSAAVSLGVCIHIAQIRASTCLALVSSGAALSAPNKKSRALERAEQKIEPLGAVGADLGQFARSFRKLALCAGARGSLRERKRRDRG